MAKLTKTEQEIHIQKCADEDDFFIYSTDPTFTRLFRKLCKKTGGTEDTSQGGTTFKIPATQLRFTATKTLNLSDAERAIRSERLRNAPSL